MWVLIAKEEESCSDGFWLGILKNLLVTIEHGTSGIGNNLGKPSVRALIRASTGQFQLTMAGDTTRRLKPGEKRVRKDEAFHARKKSRTAPTVLPGKVDFQDEALQLEEKILESRTNYNSIHTLLEYLQREDGVEQERVIAAVALCRVFCRLMARGSLGKLQEGSGNEVTIMQWLRERLHDYEQELLRVLRSQEFGAQSTALTVLMRLVKEKASHLNQSVDTSWQDGLFGQLVRTFIEDEIAEETRTEFVDKYVAKYEDVRFYTFACLAYVPEPP